MNQYTSSSSIQSAKMTSSKATWRYINKSTVTNAVAILVVCLGYLSPFMAEQLKSVGMFALSGAITNWLAIYMLFEKIPGLYGSGIIPNRFEEFKIGIWNLIMNQFFTKENIERFFRDQEQKMPTLSLDPLLASLDYDKLFEKLLAAVNASPLGNMLALMGGQDALTPLKEPFIEKMQEAIKEISQQKAVQDSIRQVVSDSFDSHAIVAKVSDIVQMRLDELTPKMVKEIIQEMIRAHLGWLVVWGGVFGGILGLLAYYL